MIWGIMLNYKKSKKSKFGHVEVNLQHKEKNEARGNPKITLLDADEFVTLLIEHYEELDSNYKAIIPLRKLWVPVT
jgi:predicted Mrr-cat superfamily restriction endonuclease